jgi:predicted RNA binding protein YcfA (HicA-like mRNA interferase family)
MPKLPRLTARQIAAVLERVGFSLSRKVAAT